MADYKLHCFPESGNAYKVALYLSCAGLEWERVWVDFFNGQTRQPDWRAEVNAMGEVPVLERPDGVRMTQSGAILSYLADTTGKFAAQDADETYEILRWMMFDNHKFTGSFAPYRFLYAIKPDLGDPKVVAFLKGRTQAAFDVAETHMADRDFFVGSRPTIADFSLAGYVFYPIEQHGFDFEADYPALHRWQERLRELDGWAAPEEMMAKPE